MVLAVDYGQGVSDAWSAVATFIPKLVVFLLILLVGWLVAKAVEKILGKVLQRVGFDRWVERGGVKRALAGSRYDAAGILGRIVFYTILLFTLSVAFGVFGPNPISNYLGAVISYLPRLFVAILSLIVAAAIAAAVKGLIQNTIGGLSYGNLVANVASVLILLIGVVAALNQLEIAPAVVNAVLYAALAALAGIAIVAVGGGGIRPMQQRWERALARYDEEKRRIAEHVRQAPSVRQQAERAAAAARPTQDGSGSGSGATAVDYPYGSGPRH